MSDKELIAMYSALDKVSYSYDDVLNFMFLARNDEAHTIENKIKVLFSDHGAEATK